MKRKAPGLFGSVFFFILTVLFFCFGTYLAIEFFSLGATEISSEGGEAVGDAIGIGISLVFIVLFLIISYAGQLVMTIPSLCFAVKLRKNCAEKRVFATVLIVLLLLMLLVSAGLFLYLQLRPAA